MKNTKTQSAASLPRMVSAGFLMWVWGTIIMGSVAGLFIRGVTPDRIEKLAYEIITCITFWLTFWLFRWLGPDDWR